MGECFISRRGGNAGAIRSITISENGTYNAPSTIAGYTPIIVSVPSSTSVYAFVTATYNPEEACVCTDGTTTLIGGVGGSHVFAIPNAGTWTFTCLTDSKTVTVDTYGASYTVALN